jgi:hypothetical protein
MPVIICDPDGPGEPTQPDEREVPMMRGVPEKVQAAFSFVNLCDQFSTPVVLRDETGLRLAERDLHPAQEQVFRMACRCLGEYFCDTVSVSGEVPHVDPAKLRYYFLEHPDCEVPFLDDEYWLSKLVGWSVRIAAAEGLLLQFLSGIVDPDVMETHEFELYSRLLEELSDEKRPD